MGKNRDRLRIIAAVLVAAGSGASKTRIMYDANLSFKLLEKYLKVVISAGFVRSEDSNYHLTKHGHAFLNNYRNLQDRYFRAQEVVKALDFERRRLVKQCEPQQMVYSICSGKFES